MIIAYTGTPGSGKSLHTSYEIWDQITLRKKRLIYNKYLYTAPLVKKLGKKDGLDKLNERLLIVNDDKRFTPPLLINFALQYHVPGKENQTLIIIEEAANFFSKEEFRLRADCFAWRKFMREHRQYGFDIILVTQKLSFIDTAIAGCVEREINHRAVANFKGFGRFVSFICGGIFSYSQRWVAIKPSVREKGGMFRLNRKKAKIYRTMEMLDGHTENKKTKEKKHEKINDFEEQFRAAKAEARATV